MFVQRGETNVNGASETIVLDTPVKVGESFVKYSIRTGNNIGWNAALCKITLKNEVDGHYTELEISRGDTSGSVDVAWEVITGSQFKVQIIERSFAGTDASSVIEAVDLNKAFIINSNSAANAASGRALVRAKFTDNETVAFNVTNALTGPNKNVTAYIVEWEGASVQSGDFTLNGTSETETITNIDIEKSFVIHNWMVNTTAPTSTHRTICRARITNVNEVTFDRGDSDSSIDLHYFVIEHPNINVQSSDGNISGTEVNDSINEIDLDKTFIGGGYITNANSNISELFRGLLSYFLSSNNNIQIQRGNSFSSVNYGFEIVEVTDEETKRRTALALLI